MKLSLQKTKPCAIEKFNSYARHFAGIILWRKHIEKNIFWYKQALYSNTNKNIMVTFFIYLFWGSPTTQSPLPLFPNRFNATDYQLQILEPWRLLFDPKDHRWEGGWAWIKIGFTKWAYSVPNPSSDQGLLNKYYIFCNSSLRKYN